MTICFTLSSLSAGGAERVAVSLANAFVKKGHKVILLLVSIDHNNSFYELEESIDVVPLIKNDKDKKIFRRIRILREKLLSLNPDIIISFLPHICIYTYLATRKTQIPFICSERNDPNQYNLLYKTLLRKSFKNANGCVFQTSDARDYYHFISDDRARVIFNPVCLNLSNDIVRKQEKDKIFISVGRLVEQKNFPLLIRSFSSFIKLKPDYKLIIYGEGPLRKSLEGQIKNLGLQEQVSLPGNNPNWHDYAVNATGFISTSNYEGMPNCLEEALCLGCPSIATNCPIGGSKDLISLLGYGILINMNDEKQLVSSMLEISEKNYSLENINTEPIELNNISEQWLTFIDKILKK